MRLLGHAASQMHSLLLLLARHMHLAFDAFMKWLFGGSTFGTTLSNTTIVCSREEVVIFSSDQKLRILATILLAAPPNGPKITFLSRTNQEKSASYIRDMLRSCALVALIESSYSSDFLISCRKLAPSTARMIDGATIAADFCTTVKTRSDRQDIKTAANAAIQIVDRTCFDLVHSYEFHELLSRSNVVETYAKVHDFLLKMNVAS
eukprot:m.1607257 g.1607257  ORF g.1607257 m.1607257 type:complete len:206 (-) comp25361_c0_seq48:1250-1867(-)